MNNPNTQDRPTAGRPSNDPGPAGWHGPALTFILRDHGWTQADLAEEVGVAAPTIGSWVGWPGGKNSRPPAGWQIRLICEVLEAPRSAFGSMEGAVAWINSLADLEAEETEA